ncbi:RNA exonuclease 1 homolog isoform X2 [Ornithorhynchus anatinus]|uniref:Exonuclease domain-containing protein n=1 Tax=Ornithorhynchus anatinus TaxID=9258 RepID=A0A6I8NHH5_ORNAN|nr:RNA exonuclease 1 homolog isoform X2 [Ornithorhynchus anatinus]
MDRSDDKITNTFEEKQKTQLQCHLGPQELPQNAIPSFPQSGMDERNAKQDETSVKDSSEGNDLVSQKHVTKFKYPAPDLGSGPLLNYSSGVTSASKIKVGSAVKADRSEQSPNFSSSLESCYEPSKKTTYCISPIKLKINLESDEDELVIDAPPLVAVAKKSRRSRSLPIEKESLRGKCEGNLQNSHTKLALLETVKEQVDVDKHGQSDVNPSEKPGLAVENAGFHGLESYVSKMERCSENKQYLFTSEESKSSASPPQIQIKKKKSEKDHSKDEILVKRKSVQEEQMKEFLHLPNISQPDVPSSERNSEEKIKLTKDVRIPGAKMKRGKWDNLDCDMWPSLSKKSCSIGEPGGGTDPSSSKGSNIKITSDLIVTKAEEELTEDSTQSSDSSEDPVEECRRIFNEFEKEMKKKPIAKKVVEKPAEQTTLDSRIILVPRQKKRIAHIAKFEATFTAQAHHKKVQQDQQPSLWIASGVKSGESSDAATNEKKAAVKPLTAQSQDVKPQDVLKVPCSSTVPEKRIFLLPQVTKWKRSLGIPYSTPKVPQETRQRYLNLFVKEHLEHGKTMNEAFEEAKKEEKAIYDRCGSKKMYLNIAVNTLKKLRNPIPKPLSDQGAVSTGSSESKFTTPETRGMAGAALYRHLREYILTGQQLYENNYPQPNPGRPGNAVFYNEGYKWYLEDATRRLCCRCGKIYSVTSSGSHIQKEECSYHYGKMLRFEVAGGLETRYSCCDGGIGSSGCQTAKFHVHDGRKENLDGFVETYIKYPPFDGNPGVYAVDSEMSYTVQGLEITRVTVVDPNLVVVYDTFVKPDNEIIDYNTRFSGVTEENLKNVTTSIRDVQAVLLNLFSADTILIGHSFECDLCALKLIHNTVVDTSIVFPHQLGLPHKRPLRQLMADFLKRIIQNGVGGHNSIEDAAACMELMLWKVKEDNKGRKWARFPVPF